MSDRGSREAHEGLVDDSADPLQPSTSGDAADVTEIELLAAPTAVHTGGGVDQDGSNGSATASERGSQKSSSSHESTRTGCIGEDVACIELADKAEIAAGDGPIEGAVPPRQQQQQQQQQTNSLSSIPSSPIIVPRLRTGAGGDGAATGQGIDGISPIRGENDNSGDDSSGRHSDEFDDRALTPGPQSTPSMGSVEAKPSAVDILARYDPFALLGMTSGEGPNCHLAVPADMVVEPEALVGENCCYNLRETSCFIFPASLSIRRLTFEVVDHNYFERLVLLVIAANCITLVLDAPELEHLAGMEKFQEVSEIFFLALFTLEMVLKVFALGFAFHQHSYLRSGWNVIDFIIVVLGYVAIASTSSKFSVIRLVRVLRPLKAVAKVPGLSSLMTALFNAMPHMADVFLMLLFFLVIFSILGLQIFGGVSHQRCYAMNGSAVVLVDDAYDVQLPCTTSSDAGGRFCPPGSMCTVRLDLYNDQVVNFDRIYFSMIVVLKVVTLDNWPDDVAKYQAAVGFWVWIYFFGIVILGAYFCVNLVLAVLSNEYQKAAEANRDVEELADESEEDAGDDEVVDNNGPAEWRGMGAELDVDTEDPEKLAGSLGFGMHGSPRERRGSKGSRGSRAGSVTSASGLGAVEDRRRGSTASSTGPAPKITGKFVTTGAFSGSATPPSRSKRSRSVAVTFAAAETSFDTVDASLAESSATLYAPPLDSGTSPRASPFHSPVGSPRHSPVASPRHSPLTSPRRRTGSHPRPNPKRRKTLAQRAAYYTDRAGDAPQYALLLKARGYLRVLVTHVYFNRFMIFVTVTNVLALAIDHHEIDAQLADALENINFSCSIVFITEAAAKIAALGPSYFGDKFNVFDFVLVVVSIPEMILLSGGSAFSALRAFRLARILRVVKSWKKMRMLIFTILRAAASTAYLFLLMCLFILIFAILGVNLMVGAFPHELRANFNTLWESLLAVFIVVSGDTWATVMVNGMRYYHDAIVIYFLAAFLIGNYILINLFIAILIDSFSASEESGGEEPPQLLAVQLSALSEQGRQSQLSTSADMNVRRDDQDQQSNDNEEELAKRGMGEKRFSFGHQSLDTTLDHDQSIDLMDMKPQDFELENPQGLKRLQQLHDRARRRYKRRVEAMELYGNSLFVFGPVNKFRLWCARTISHPYFEPLVLFAIVANSVILGMESPSAREQQDMQQLFFVSDVVFTVLFAVESFMKIVAMGFVLGPTAYLKSSWNVLDFVVVVTSIIGFFVDQLRLLRSLRSFRIAARSRAIKTVLTTLFNAIPSIVNVCALALFCFLIFGILGVQLFKGSFAKCSDPAIVDAAHCVGFYNVSTEAVAPRVWSHEINNFNHLGSAMLTLFIVALGEEWAVVMFNGIDSSGVDEAMRRNARPYMGIFFVVFVLLGAFFSLNLFVGSLVESFRVERDKREGILGEDGCKLITDEQALWIGVHRLLQRSKLEPKYVRPHLFIRSWCYSLCVDTDEPTKTSSVFDFVITACILINVAFMCIEHYGQTEIYTDLIWHVNLAFAIIFAIEALIKQLAMGVPMYFRDNWNIFDFCLVIAAFVGLFAGGVGTNALRVLRVGRIFRLIKRAKGLQRLFNTLLYSLPSIANISMLLILVYFVFAVLGTELFGKIIIGRGSPAFTKNFCFRNVGLSMLLLCQISTTEGWTAVLESAIVAPDNSPCTHDEGNCGTLWAVPYFICFLVVSNLIGLNLFFFVIVDNYYQLESASADETTNDRIEMLRHFKLEWAHVDPQATEHARWESLVLILRKLPPPLGFPPNASDFVVMRRLRELDVAVDTHGRIRYYDCVYALAKEIFRVDHDSAKAVERMIAGAPKANPGYFKVFHAFAVKKILRGMKRMKFQNIAHKVMALSANQKQLSQSIATKYDSPLVTRPDDHWVSIDGTVVAATDASNTAPLPAVPPGPNEQVVARKLEIELGSQETT